VVQEQAGKLTTAQEFLICHLVLNFRLLALNVDKVFIGDSLAETTKERRLRQRPPVRTNGAQLPST
jgi:hypothetical protein